ncbi:hypothetical protein F5Y09DRAFT_48169 [Xylaria sp. FL1042]|nr:hypothetical protein F5Y09DRAFT_48169 [Xylaria sp. FL1042]
MEQQVQKALNYLKEFPSAKIATVVRSFGITRAVLRNRISGRGGEFRQPSEKLKLKPAEEEAICNYIDRLDLSWVASPLTIMPITKRSAIPQSGISGLPYVYIPSEYRPHSPVRQGSESS